jgi:hypothetical protein
MKRIAAGLCAVGCAFAVSLSAQDTKVTTTTKTDGGELKQVTYSGCLGPGAETRTYVLNKVVPVTRTTETATPDGTVTTTETRYALVPDAKVEVQQHMGHKVEVTGVIIPAGESKVKTETKVDNENAKDTKSTTTIKTDSPMAQFRATSIRSTGEACD